MSKHRHFRKNESGAAAAEAHVQLGKIYQAQKKTGKTARKEPKPGPLADFGKTEAPPDVVHVANWASYTRNHKKKAFVLIDKKAAQLYELDHYLLANQLEGVFNTTIPADVTAPAVLATSPAGTMNGPLTPKVTATSALTPAASNPR